MSEEQRDIVKITLAAALVAIVLASNYFLNNLTEPFIEITLLAYTSASCLIIFLFLSAVAYAFSDFTDKFYFFLFKDLANFAYYVGTVSVLTFFLVLPVSWISTWIIDYFKLPLFPWRLVLIGGIAFIGGWILKDLIKSLRHHRKKTKKKTKRKTTRKTTKKKTARKPKRKPAKRKPVKRKT